jgi:hypothetical protein
MSAPTDDRRGLLDLRIAKKPPAVLAGTNPVLDAVEAGHFERSRTEKEPKEPARLCRSCGTGWPCAAVNDARRAARVRAGR